MMNIKWHDLIRYALFMTIGWGVGVNHAGTSLWWAPLVGVAFLCGFLVVEVVEWVGGILLRRWRTES